MIQSREKYYSSSTCGPTCDGLVQIIEGYDLPEMPVRGWTHFENTTYTLLLLLLLSLIPEACYLLQDVTTRVQLTKQVPNYGFPPEVDEQDVSTLPMAGAQESGTDHHPKACASPPVSL